MNVLEHKGIGYEPIYERTILTDNLHNFSSFNTDFEIISYKKMKKFLILLKSKNSTHFF